MQRGFIWVLMLVVVAAVGVQGLSELGKPFPSEQAVLALETALQQLAERASDTPPRAEELASELGIVWKEGKVRVVVETIGPLSVDAIRSLGGEILAWADACNLLEVKVPPVGLVELAGLPEVRFVRRPYWPVPFVVSEGVQVSGAATWHVEGYEGQGGRVAVIDVEFGGLTAALAAGEVDRVIFSRDYTGEGLEAGGVHGTACAEIVHDMAPGAELLLMKIANEVQLSNAVDDAIAYGANVITCSLGWFNTNFYDGTGTIAQIVSSAVQSGILWVNAAGNCADGGHWEGAWQDANANGWLDYTPWDEVNDFYLGGGQSIILWLTWDAWSGSDQDYDLYLVDEWGNTVASSQNWQTGAQEPVESIYYTAPVAAGTYYGIKIAGYDAPEHPRMELFCIPYGLPLEYTVAESSIAAPANASFVFSVGAIDQRDWETGPQETFSSQGPTNSSQHATSITKPDICGPDGVSGSSYGSVFGGGGFWGTSASSPHVAGAAALVWSAHPSWSAANIRGWLEENAVDMGPVGKDNLYGHGRLHLPLAGGSELCTSLHPDWNLISLPLDPEDRAPQAVFDEVTGILYLYQWDPATGSWKTVGNGLLTQVGALGGYWLWLPEEIEVCVNGTTLTGAQSLVLGAAGWQMIGVPYEVAWGNVTNGGSISITRGPETKSLAQAVAAGWIFGTIWEWDAPAEAWITTTVSVGLTLAPWNGYWIYTYVDGLTLGFSETAGPVGGSPLPAAMAMETVLLGNPPMPQPPSLGPAAVRVVNEPNPVTDGHTTTFRVLGICPCSVRGLWIEVYDLAGRLVWQGESEVAVLTWHAQDALGQSLANGVYLYRAQVKIGGEWITMPLQKLAILQ